MSTPPNVPAAPNVPTPVKPPSRTARSDDKPFVEASSSTSHQPSPCEPRRQTEEIPVSLHDDAGTDADDESLEQQHNRRPYYGSLGSTAQRSVNNPRSLHRRDSFPPDNGHALLRVQQGQYRAHTPAPTSRNASH